MARAIKRVLKERDLSDAKFVKMVGMKRSTFSNWASGRTEMSDEKVEVIAKFLKLKPDDISKHEGAMLKEAPVSYGSKLGGLSAFTLPELWEKVVDLTDDESRPDWERATIGLELLQEIIDRKEP